VFAETSHVLNDRKIDPKKALLRGGRDASGRDPIKKVFVGGLPPEFPLEDIKEYFGKFGKVSISRSLCVYVHGARQFMFEYCCLVYVGKLLHLSFRQAFSSVIVHVVASC